MFFSVFDLIPKGFKVTLRLFGVNLVLLGPFRSLSCSFWFPVDRFWFQNVKRFHPGSNLIHKDPEKPSLIFPPFPAHCVAHFSAWDVARLTVHLGDYNIRIATEVKHVERKVKRVVRHKGFDSRTLYNDIAILTLDKKVPFSKGISPICLPSAASGLHSGKTGTVIGWGSLREMGAQPSVLQEVTLPIWTNEECRAKYGAAGRFWVEMWNLMDIDNFKCFFQHPVESLVPCCVLDRQQKVWIWIKITGCV